MESVKAKKIVVFIALCRVDAESNFTVNKIPETFDSMGFGVEVSKLHI